MMKKDEPKKASIIRRWIGAMCLPALGAALWMLGAAGPAIGATTAADLCGAPSYDRTKDSGMYVWEERCGDPIRTFEVRALAGAGGLATTYLGRVDSDLPLSAVAPFSLESADTMEVLDRGSHLPYEMNVGRGSQDGFGFSVSSGASICFGPDLPMGATVRIGAKAKAVQAPFDLATLEPCTPPPLLDACGPPTYDPAVESGPFLWRDCTAVSKPVWELNLAGGGLLTKVSGTITSDKPITGVVPVSLESKDALDKAGDRLSFSLQSSGAGIDGFKITLVPGTANCIDIPSMNPADLKLGPNKLGAAILPLNLETLGPCVVPTATAMSVLVVLTDDQRWDSTWAMPKLERLLNRRGVVFQNAFVSTPLCAPTRSSILSGGFSSSNTGVLQVTGAMGGSRVFRPQDFDTIATALRNVGYKTMFAGGKYINGYASPYIPPGWDRFVVNNEGPLNGDWFNYDVTTGSSGSTPSIGEVVTVKNDYVTNYHRDQVLDFLDGLKPAQPFLAYFSAYAPHGPAVPDTVDANLYPDYVYRDRAYGESDLSDKPDWVANTPVLTPAEVAVKDEFYRDQLRSLAAVDRALAAFIRKLEQLGRLNNTVIIFASDNGYLWGEHGLHGKQKAYEESIRVPLTVYMPGVAPRRERSLVSVDLDIAPTILDLAGVDAATDGLSLLPLLKDPAAAWRGSLVFQSWGTGAASSWSAIRTQSWKLIENVFGDVELYDLKIDPFEMESQHANPRFAGRLTDLTNQLTSMRGLSVTASTPPSGTVGVPYTFRAKASGGRSPYYWSVVSGALPPGLSLDQNTGVISGIPTVASKYAVGLSVEDSSVRPRLGGPQKVFVPTGVYATSYTLIIR